jgi:hypothetical protein
MNHEPCDLTLKDLETAINSDFMPDFKKNELIAELYSRQQADRDAIESTFLI